MAEDGETAGADDAKREDGTLRKPAPPSQADRRRDRLAEALRDNLKRRKAAARSRADHKEPAG
jgi:hypothetical protein